MKNKIDESRVIIENGEVKTILSEEIQRTRWMSVEESENICLQNIAKIREIMKQQNASQN